MKSIYSAEESAAIERFRKNHNVVLQLSTYPSVRFRDRDAIPPNDIIQKDVLELVYEHRSANEEESKQRAKDKKNQEREDKWKQTSGRFSS